MDQTSDTHEMSNTIIPQPREGLPRYWNSDLTGALEGRTIYTLIAWINSQTSKYSKISTLNGGAMWMFRQDHSKVPQTQHHDLLNHQSDKAQALDHLRRPPWLTCLLNMIYVHSPTTNTKGTDHQVIQHKVIVTACCQNTSIMIRDRLVAIRHFTIDFWPIS